jgi:hypothetical protein
MYVCVCMYICVCVCMNISDEQEASPKSLNSCASLRHVLLTTVFIKSLDHVPMFAACMHASLMTFYLRASTYTPMFLGLIPSCSMCACLLELTFYMHTYINTWHKFSFESLSVTWFFASCIYIYLYIYIYMHTCPGLCSSSFENLSSLCFLRGIFAHVMQTYIHTLKHTCSFEAHHRYTYKCMHTYTLKSIYSALKAHYQLCMYAYIHTHTHTNIHAASKAYYRHGSRDGHGRAHGHCVETQGSALVHVHTRAFTCIYICVLSFECLLRACKRGLRIDVYPGLS